MGWERDWLGLGIGEMLFEGGGFEGVGGVGKR